MNNRNLSIQSLAVLLLLLLTTACGSVGTRAPQDRYVVVLSCDGFRDSYMDSFDTPHLRRLAARGVRGEFIPCFPTVTFPNHYSMATGLHPNNHGLVNNTFWDRKSDKKYSLGDRNAVEDPTFYFGEPIWTTAEKQGIRSASYFWVGSETAINGHQPTRWKKFDAKVPFEVRADSVLAWMNLPAAERPRLIMWYLDEPDHTGHGKGTDSPQTAKMVARVDSVIGYFYDKMQTLPYADRVDFIVVSDHGMANYYPDRYVNLNDYLNRSDFDFVTEGVPSLLYLKDPSKRGEILAKLEQVPHIKAYAREEVPAHLKYGSNPRIGDIVVIPEIGTMVQFREKGVARTGAAHGYDNVEPAMHALFVACGPGFRHQSRKLKAVPNITLYPLICKLLGIRPAKNDANPGDVMILQGRR